MNLHPVIGDTWSKLGSTTYRVAGFEGRMVILSYGKSGFAVDLHGYLRMVERDQKHGFTLTRNEEPEECIFE